MEVLNTMPSLRSLAFWCFAVTLIFVLISPSYSISLDQIQLPTSVDEDNADLYEKYFNRDRRFPKMLTCDIDKHCLRLDRASCCAQADFGAFKVCKPLQQKGEVCNAFANPHLWSGVRMGFNCPCARGLQCVTAAGKGKFGICL